MGLPVTFDNGPFPDKAIPLAVSSGNVANAVAAATLLSVANRLTYLAGFEVSGSGATAGLPVLVTVTGLLGGTATYIYTAEAGVLVGNKPLVVPFDPPLPASAVNVNIVVSCPALGAGNTNNSVNAHGFNL